MRRILTNAILALIAAELGEPVGDAKAPPPRTGDPSLTPPYVVVYPSTGNASGPPFGGFANDLGIGYSVVAVGANREQAEGVSDEIRLILLTRNLVLASGFVMGRDSSGLGAGGYDGTLYNSPEMFDFWVTPDA